MLPIIHIEQLAKRLGIERRWIAEHWINPRGTDHDNDPCPHFRDGQHVFFDLEELHLWAKRRSAATVATRGHVAQ